MTEPDPRASTGLLANPQAYYGQLPKERVDCDLCGSSRCTLLHVGDRYRMGIRTVYCEDCGLVYANPRPTQAAYDDFYRSHYRLLYESVEKPTLEDYVLRFRLPERAQQKVDFIVAHMSLRGPLRILDAGCGEGSLLKSLQGQWPTAQLFGVEPGEGFAEFAASYTSARILIGRFADFVARYPSLHGTFDLVIFSHVLEHLLSPTAELQLAQSLLKEGGFLYVEHPNIIYPSEALVQLHIAHPYCFYPETIEALLLKCGYRPLGNKTDGFIVPWDMCTLAQRVAGPLPFLKPSPSLIAERIGSFRRRLDRELGAQSDLSVKGGVTPFA